MRAEATDTEEEEEEDLTLTQQLEGIMEEEMTQQEECGERDPSAGTDWEGVWDLLNGFCFQEQATEGPVAFDGGPGGTDWEGLWQLIRALPEPHLSSETTARKGSASVS